MVPRFIQIEEKKFVGNRLSMSISDNKMGQLWSGFQRDKSLIPNKISTELISLVIYPPGYFSRFDPTREFERWALAEVPDFDQLPTGMDPFVLPGGLYAVFDYKGLNSDPSPFQFIFNTWLPDSGFELDERPHFEVLGEKYKNNDPTSEEEIWIPLKPGITPAQIL